MFTKTDAEDGVHWQEIDTTKFLPATAKVLDVLVNLLKNKVEKRKSGIKFQRNIPSAELPHFSNALSFGKSGCFSVFE